jgi:hypothetical protein
VIGGHIVTPSDHCLLYWMREEEKDRERRFVFVNVAGALVFLNPAPDKLLQQSGAHGMVDKKNNKEYPHDAST